MATIRTPDQRLRVFISSTMDELADERGVARKAVERLHLSPILFEMGARPHPPRELYRAYLEQSDIFIGIYGDSYGWIAPEATISGIEDEYNLSEGMPRLIYVRAAAGDREPRLAEMLQRVSVDGISYRTYRRPSELQRLVVDDLALLLSERFGPSESAAEEPGEEERKRDLPAPTTRLVGRHREILDLQDMIADDDVRLLTLTGPGGIGKTRLALALAESSQERFEDGAAAVFLAPVRSADLVPTKMATALGLPVTGSRSATDVIKDYLRSRELLILIDNFEHMIAAASVVAEVLEECPRVKIVVTSREMLRLSAEHVFAVPPLAHEGNPDGHAAAVELFLDRAIAIRHDLPLTDDVMAAVTEICKRLDGLPLAIELAASRVRVLMPTEILARLHSRLQFLTGGPSDFPERQRTLRCAIEWSYDLLDEREQRLFDCLSVFRGGFTLEAAEGVITDEPDLLEGLASLLDKSLIRSDVTAAEPRFTMLETLREFASERLEARRDGEELRRRHAVYFTDWVSGLETVGHEPETFHQMGAESDNLRAAFGRLLESGDPGRVARAAGVLWKFWWIRSLFLEGINWMERVRASEVPISAHERATVEFVIGMLAFGNGDYPRAALALAKSSAGFQQEDDLPAAAMASICLGVIWRVQGKPEGEDLLRGAVEVLERAGDEWGSAFALFGLGRVISLDGRPQEAVSILEDAIERLYRTRSETLLAFALVNLGWARIALPDTDGAKRAMVRALEEGATLDNRDSMARAVEGVAGVALMEGDVRRAAALFGGAEAIRRSIGGVVWIPDMMSHAAIETTLRDRLGDDQFEADFDLGAQLTVQGAVDLAMSGAGATDDRRKAFAAG